MGAQGCCGVEQSCGCFTPSHKPWAVRGLGAIHPLLPAHRGLVPPLQSPPATSIEEHGAGVGLACQQLPGQAWKGVCVFSASIPNSETITI